MLLKTQCSKTRSDCSKDQREKITGTEMFVYENQGIYTLRHFKVKLSTSFLPYLQAKMSWRRSEQSTWLRLLPDKIGHISFFSNYKRLLQLMKWLRCRTEKLSPQQREWKNVQTVRGVKADVLKLRAVLQDFPIPGGHRLPSKGEGQECLWTGFTLCKVCCQQ